MKTLVIKIILVLLIVSGFTSCSDWLVVQPAGKVVLADYWKSESDVESVVATCYRAMLDDEFMRRIMIWGELRSDNIIAGNGIQDPENQVLQANIIPSNELCKWGSFYSVINYCNTVLYYAPTVIDPNFTETKLHAKEAEVLTLRALCYFYLVRVYKDIPLVTEPSILDTQNYQVSQSTEDQVLDKIEADLLQAENWAMVAYSTTQYTKGRITKNAVRAILADVYLWRNKYPECINYCDKIINDRIATEKLTDSKVTNDVGSTLIQDEESPFRQIFGQKNSSESIFELQFSTANKENSKVYDYYGNFVNNAGQFSASTFLGTGVYPTAGVYPATDVRRKDNFKALAENGLFHIFKYAGLYRSEDNLGVSSYNYRSSTPNWIFYRITDIMLMKAEALVQLDRDDNDLTAALHIVNTTYLRSNPTVLPTDSLKFSNYNSKQTMAELVLLERQRELMFEGKRWFDLMRMARRDGKPDKLVYIVIGKYTDNQTTIKSKMSEMNALYMPIHQDELKANPKLKQNPFYDVQGISTSTH